MIPDSKKIIAKIYLELKKKIAGSIWKKGVHIKDGNIVQLNRKKIGSSELNQFIITTVIDLINDYSDSLEKALPEDDFLFLGSSILSDCFQGTVEDWKIDIKQIIVFND